MSSKSCDSPAGVDGVNGDADAVMPLASAAMVVSTSGTSGEAGTISVPLTSIVRPTIAERLSSLQLSLADPLSQHSLTMLADGPHVRKSLTPRDTCNSVPGAGNSWHCLRQNGRKDADTSQNHTVPGTTSESGCARKVKSSPDSAPVGAVGSSAPLRSVMTQSSPTMSLPPTGSSANKTHPWYSGAEQTAS